jgi:OmcA/MtrC family decaheme c-type cytochrome
MDAMGSFTLGIEGRADAVLNPGENNEMEVEDQMQNFAEGFAVTDTMPVDRRMVVDDAKCESCHANLSLHGDNRNDANTYCQTCHRPAATDAAVRPEGTGPNESIHFKYMIHKIHRGEELENGYLVYGYRSSLHDFGHVEYPGDLRNCEKCHVDDSYTLPLPDGVLETPESATSILEPLLPTASACLSCHDSDAAAVHADANSTDLGESCDTCHSTGKTYSVERVHAR